MANSKRNIAKKKKAKPRKRAKSKSFPRNGSPNPNLFQPGNEIWKKAQHAGRPRIFKDPKELWDAASEYFQWCVDNPLIEVDFRGKWLQRVELPKWRVFTWEGLELYVGCYSLRQYKKDEAYSEFSQVIDEIERVIYSNKFEGAAAGFLNANIISRDLGLRDKTDITTDGKEFTTPPPIHVFNTAPPLADSEDKIQEK